MSPSERCGLPLFWTLLATAMVCLLLFVFPFVISIVVDLGPDSDTVVRIISCVVGAWASYRAFEFKHQSWRMVAAAALVFHGAWLTVFLIMAAVVMLKAWHWS